MRNSQMISKAIIQGKKEIALNPGLQTELTVGRRVESIFSKPFSRLPRPFLNELFAYGWNQVLLGRLDVLSDFSDLLQMDYDQQSDCLIQGDWVFLSEITNEWAIDLDITLLEYIMMQVLDHKALDLTLTSQSQDDEDIEDDE